MAKKKKQLIWACDPFMRIPEPHRWGAFLDALATSHHATIEPVYVLSPDGFNWTGEFTNPWVQKYKPLAEETYARLREQLQTKESTEVKVLVNQKLSKRLDVKKLLGYVQAKKAAFVVVQTHGRRGFERAVLGSFAETLMLNAKVPLLVVNPHTSIPATIKRAVFATDLGKKSKASFSNFARQFKGALDEVVLYHKLPDPIEPIVQSGVLMAGGGWVSFAQFQEREIHEAQKKMDNLANEGKKMGLHCRTVVDNKPGLIVESILGLVKRENADLLVTVNHTGPVAGILLGSVTRELLRSAHQPVFVYHA